MFVMSFEHNVVAIFDNFDIMIKGMSEYDWDKIELIPITDEIC